MLLAIASKLAEYLSLLILDSLTTKLANTSSRALSVRADVSSFMNATNLAELA